MNIEIGKQYNNWLVLSVGSKGKYTCQCICGTKRDVTKDNLGRVLGCGCVRKPYAKSTPSPTKTKKPNTVPLGRLSPSKPPREHGQESPLGKPPTAAQIKKCQARRKIEYLLEQRELNKMHGEIA
jgi:hypothetical protein